MSYKKQHFPNEAVSRSQKAPTLFASFFAAIVLILSLQLCGCSLPDGVFSKSVNVPDPVEAPEVDVAQIPGYTGSPSVELNDDEPYFEVDDYEQQAFEEYSPLDRAGRCGSCMAMVGKEIMPTEERGSIGQVKPTGWHLAKYDWVDGKYLYNRCHLIGYQLSGENANKRNLITGTRYMNVEGMEPYENQIADYVKRTNNHVLYRVTPLFVGDEDVARGVVMEAESIEDAGKGILFCVYCYNVQPGVAIDYATGDNQADGTMEAVLGEDPDPAESADSLVEDGEAGSSADPVIEKRIPDYLSSSPEASYFVLNTNTMKFHQPTCSAVERMSEKNKMEYAGSYDEIIRMGYDPCKKCCP